VPQKQQECCPPTDRNAQQPASSAEHLAEGTAGSAPPEERQDAALLAAEGTEKLQQKLRVEEEPAQLPDGCPGGLPSEHSTRSCCPSRRHLCSCGLPRRIFHTFGSPEASHVTRLLRNSKYCSLTPTCIRTPCANQTAVTTAWVHALRRVFPQLASQEGTGSIARLQSFGKHSPWTDGRLA